MNTKITMLNLCIFIKFNFKSIYFFIAPAMQAILTSEAVTFRYRASVPTTLSRQIAFQRWPVAKYSCNNIQAR